MALALRAEIQNKTGKWPHLVLSKVHQKKVMVSLSLAHGTNLYQESMEIYQTYHGFLTLAIEKVKYNGLILIPIINYRYENVSPDQKKTVLLYGLSKNDIHSRNFSSPYITIRHFAKMKNIPLQDIIIGKYSFGAHLERLFIFTIPSDSIDQSRGINIKYGGYKHSYRFNVIFRYSINKNMSAINVIIPKFYTTKLMRDHYADLFARGLKEFLNQEYKDEEKENTEETETLVQNTTEVVNYTIATSTSVQLTMFYNHFILAFNLILQIVIAVK